MSSVLVVIGGNGGAPSGADHMALLTASHLAARGHRVAVVAEVPHRSPLSDAIPVLSLGEVARGTRPLPWPPDVVHAFDLARPAAATIAADIAQRAGGIFALTPASARAVWPDETSARTLCSRADVVFALTHDEAETLITTGASAERIVLVEQGPQLAGPADDSLAAGWFAPHSAVVLFLGRRLRSKGCLILLDAAPLVWRERPDTAFAFAGPPCDAEVERAMDAVRDSRIRDFGVVDEATKRALLAACDVLCLPSTADVFPLVFVEAWASGTPVVSGTFAGAREVVRDGVDGLVVPPEPSSIAGALLHLLSRDDLRRAMGAAGRARVETELSWERVAQRTADAYRAAAHAGAPREQEARGW